MRIMVSRIAVAVLFVGIIVAVLIEYNIPSWLFEIVRQGPTQRAIYALTPDIVIARCGAPISDDTQSHPGPRDTIMISREMAYRGGTGSVTLAFARMDEGSNQGRWVLNAMNDSVSHFRYGTAKSKLAALPCLTGK